MRHERVVMWVAVVMAVMMICGAAGLYMTQHISILFVCLHLLTYLCTFVAVQIRFSFIELGAVCFQTVSLHTGITSWKVTLSSYGRSIGYCS